MGLLSTGVMWGGTLWEGGFYMLLSENVVLPLRNGFVLGTQGGGGVNLTQAPVPAPGCVRRLHVWGPSAAAPRGAQSRHASTAIRAPLAPEMRSGGGGSPRTPTRRRPQSCLRVRTILQSVSVSSRKPGGSAHPSQHCHSFPAPRVPPTREGGSTTKQRDDAGRAASRGMERGGRRDSKADEGGRPKAHGSTGLAETRGHRTLSEGEKDIASLHVSERLVWAQEAAAEAGRDAPSAASGRPARAGAGRCASEGPGGPVHTESSESTCRGDRPRPLGLFCPNGTGTGR